MENKPKNSLDDLFGIKEDDLTDSESNVFIYSEVDTLDEFIDLEEDSEKSISEILASEGIITKGEVTSLDDFFDLTNNGDFEIKEHNHSANHELLSLTEFESIVSETIEETNSSFSIVGIDTQAPEPTVNLRPSEFVDYDKDSEIFEEDLDFSDIIETDDIASMNIESSVPFVTEVESESDYILITAPLSNALADFFKNDRLVPEGNTAVAFELEGEHFIFRRINAEPKVLYLLQETLKASNLFRVKDDEVSQLSIYDYLENCKFS